MYNIEDEMNDSIAPMLLSCYVINDGWMDDCS